MVLCTEFKAHLVKNHKLLNRIIFCAKILTVENASLSLLLELQQLSIGLVKTQVKMSKLIASHSVIFYAQQQLSVDSMKVKKLKNSGNFLEAMVSIFISKIQASPQVLNQDFMVSLMLLLKAEPYGWKKFQTSVKWILITTLYKFLIVTAQCTFGLEEILQNT